MAEQLTGKELDDRAKELEIEGRSGMTADEKRAAIAEAEAAQASKADKASDAEANEAEGLDDSSIEIAGGAVTFAGPEEGEHYAGPASAAGAPSLEAQAEAAEAEAAPAADADDGSGVSEEEPDAEFRSFEPGPDAQDASKEALVEAGELDEEEEDDEPALEAPSATWDFQYDSAQALVDAGKLDEEDAIAMGALPSEEDDEPATEADFRPLDYQGDSLRALAAAGKLPEGVSDADIQAVEQGRVGEHTENAVLESARDGEYLEAKEAALEAAADADSDEEAAEAVAEEYESRGMTEAEAQDAQRRGLESLTNPRNEAQQKLVKQGIEMGEDGETTEEGLRKPDNVFETREEKEEAEVELEHAADAGHEVPRDPAGDEDAEEASERLSEEEGGASDDE